MKYLAKKISNLIPNDINMKKFKIVWALIPLLLAFISTTNAVTLWTLRWAVGGDFNQEPVPIEGQRSIFNTISLVNNYLWFAIGLACFWFMIWNGYQLIMARGDEKQMKTATDALIGSAVWLAVCILAHIIVNIAVRLFQ